MNTDNLLQKLNRSNIVIVSHIFASGPALDLEQYLKDKAKNLFFIGHPFSFKRDIGSFYRQYASGKLNNYYESPFFQLPEILLNIKDALLTFWWVLRLGFHVNIYIGSDNFSAFLGLLLKALGKVDDVILYTIDYMPQRFKNNALNRLYHFFDQQCLKHCKVVWNVSVVMAKAREKYTGRKQNECVPQIVVPLGIWYDRIPRVPFAKRNRYQLVFLGHLLEKQGLDIVVGAMPLILKKIPQAQLVIIGFGDYEEHLRILAQKLEIKDKVIFMGYIEDHKEVEKILSQSIIAVAMYKPDSRNFTYWADPAKIKNYLASGLPVILTNVPPVAKDIEKNQCGMIAEYTKIDFSKEVVELIKDAVKLKRYSGNAVLWSKQFDWNKIFLEALEQSI